LILDSVDGCCFQESWKVSDGCMEKSRVFYTENLEIGTWTCLIRKG